MRSKRSTSLHIWQLTRRKAFTHISEVWLKELQNIFIDCTRVVSCRDNHKNPSASPNTRMTSSPCAKAGRLSEWKAFLRKKEDRGKDVISLAEVFFFPRYFKSPLFPGILTGRNRSSRETHFRRRRGGGDLIVTRFPLTDRQVIVPKYSTSAHSRSCQLQLADRHWESSSAAFRYRFSYAVEMLAPSFEGSIRWWSR